MPRRTNKFQRLVTLINRCLAEKARVTESKLLHDKVTGEPREVDVYIESPAAGYEVTISIEVVARGRRADTPWIESMHAKHSTLPTDKLILVAESGFTKPALDKAKFFGHEAVTIGEALRTDWALAAELETTGIFVLNTFRYVGRAACEAIGGGLREVALGPTSLMLNDAGGSVTLDQLVRYGLKLPYIEVELRRRIEQGAEREFTLDFTPPEKSLRVKCDGEALALTRLLIVFTVEHTSTPVEYATGKFRETPYVAGSSVSPNHSLDFVLVRNRAGQVSGYLQQPNGVRPLTPDKPESA